MADSLRVLVVSDPLCSWCWGMADALDDARAALADRVAFDLVAGGINLDSRNPVGAYGRFRLARLWAEVAAVTGQRFAPAPSADPFVYNSAYLCQVLEAVRERRGEPPFRLLRALQERFFAAGENVTSRPIIEATLTQCGEHAHAVLARADAEAIRVRAAAGFAFARSHGTAAMPNLVLDEGSARRLLAGGYLDGPTLVATIEGAVRRSLRPPA
jgi:putative protein-disulfide isomerase